ncbi:MULTISPECIES: MFS transporter [unclassified Nocardia]|uniref:MFS transporter n=1 Tax=unclassified Nocardia TaxID=2637762 RepID=UPI001CE49000|nr:MULTISPECIES: MFS transporter [unclassified Nocardia]
MSDPARTATVTEARPLVRAQVSIAATFFVHALLFASWTAHIPQIKDRLELDDADLGTVLLGAPIGSVTAMTITGWLLSRVGSTRMIQATVVGYAVCGVAVGLADSAILLFVALAFWGLFQGAFDVAMNTQAVTVEQAVATPIMSRLHGIWSIGGFAGALVGAGAVAIGVELSSQLAGLGTIAIALVWALSRALIADSVKPAVTEINSTRRVVSVPVLMLGGIAFASMLCEGVVADWSATYLRDDLGAGAASSGLGYAAYALTMVLTRLSGTVLQRRFGNRTLLPALATVFAVGICAALALHQPMAAVLGFAATGVGLALLVPSAFSAAAAVGRDNSHTDPGSAIATVAALGWFGYVSGPPLIGHLADRTGLSTALWVLPVLAIVIAATARFSGAFGVDSRRRAVHLRELGDQHSPNNFHRIRSNGNRCPDEC